MIKTSEITVSFPCWFAQRGQAGNGSKELHVPASMKSLLIFAVLLFFLQFAPPAAQGDNLDQEVDLAAGVEAIIAAENAIPIQRIDPRQTEIEIDGHLNEAAWATPPVLAQMRVIEPDTLLVPPYKTEFRMLYTDQGIYVSFDLEQPRETIVKRFTGRDEFEVNRDNVSFTLDTSGQGLYAY